MHAGHTWDRTAAVATARLEHLLGHRLAA